MNPATSASDFNAAQGDAAESALGQRRRIFRINSLASSSSEYSVSFADNIN